MKKFSRFISSLFLTLILLPSQVFADGGYHDDGNVVDFFGFIFIAVCAVTGVIVLLGLIAFVLEKLGVIKTPPAR